MSRPSDGSAMAALAASLLGRPAIGDGRAEELHEAATILRNHHSPAAQRVGAALSQWLADGGSLQGLLGLSVGRGRSHDLPSRRLLKQRRDDALRELAAALPGTPTARANALAVMLRDRHPQTLVLHATVDAVPTSPAQLLRIIKGQP